MRAVDKDTHFFQSDNLGNHREAYIKQETMNILTYGHVNFLGPLNFPKVRWW